MGSWKRAARAGAAIAAALALPGFVLAAGGKEICYLRQTDGAWQVFVTAADAKRQRQVTASPVDKIRCSWLGRERRLVVTTAAGTVLLVDAKKGGEQAVDLGERRVTDAAGLADGQGVVFSMPGPGVDTDDIWVARFAAKEPERLTKEPFLEHFPVPCPDRTNVVYSGGRGDDRHDVFRRALGAPPAADSETLTDGRLYSFEPSCAADGAVAFSSNRSGDGNYDLWVIPAAGGEPLRLTDDPGLDGHPSWSPDGKYIAFESDREGSRAVFLLDVKQKKTVRRLSPQGVAARAPVWSPR